MVLSDALVADIFQTLNHMQSLLALQQKTIAPLAEKIQAEAAAQQQRQTNQQHDTDAPSPPNGGRPGRKSDHA